MLRKIEQNPITVIITCVLIMLGVSFQYLDLTIMEARNFITAREMVDDGNWLLTTMNGEPRYQKPPLPTWFSALSGWLLGMNNLTALRFPGIIMLIIVGLASWKFSIELLNDKLQALINALITITSFYIVAIIIEGPWDIFTHGFMYLAIYQLFKLFQKENKYWKHTIFAGIFIGCSILCKGPVSFYALLLPFLISYGIVYKYKSFKPKVFSIVSVVILALVVGGWWYLYVRWADTETFLKITSKETGNWSSYNVRPFYYYWSFFTQSGIWTVPAFMSLLYPFLKRKVSNLKVYQLTWLWTILAVVLLSIIPEKKSRYLMPVLIPLALNIGFYITYITRQFSSFKTLERLPVYLNFGLITLIGLAFPFVGYFILKDYDNIPWSQFYLAALVLFVIGLCLLHNIMKQRFLIVFYFTIAFVVMAFATVSPFVEKLKPNNFKTLDDIKDIAKLEQLSVYGLQAPSPEVIWYFGDKITAIKGESEALNFPNENTFGLLIQSLSEEDEKQMLEHYHMKKVSRFDLNPNTPDSRRHRERLTSDFYILTKK